MTIVESNPAGPVSPRDTRIGWIGTGVMGLPMCGHLMQAGYAVTVHTRTRARAATLLDQGATWADSPANVARQSDVVVTMVGFPDDVRAVHLGETGVLKGMRRGGIVCDMTTTRPRLAIEIAESASAIGVSAIDAPVSGGDVGARNAALSIMVGGDRTAVDTIRPMLELLGKSVVYQGPPGAGQHAKMCNQIVIASTMIGVCESLLYCHRAGLDAGTMLESIRGGAAGCWTLDNLAPRVLKRNFDPGFRVDHFIKDMGIALEEAARMKLSLPGLALAHQLYLSLRAAGHGNRGTHALILALERMSDAGNADGAI